MKIGERIRNRRLELNMTQDELAKKLGYASRSSINKLELSRELPSKKIAQCALALDCTAAYLMGWDEVSPAVQDAIEGYIINQTNDAKRINEALDLYQRYKNADSKIQAAVEALLKSE